METVASAAVAVAMASVAALVLGAAMVWETALVVPDVAVVVMVAEAMRLAVVWDMVRCYTSPASSRSLPCRGKGLCSSEHPRRRCSGCQTEPG